MFGAQYSVKSYSMLRVICLICRIKEHFEKIQTIADTTTLPHVMRHLSSRIEEDLDLTNLMERLMKGKDQPNSLTAAEKLELWDGLKILSMDKCTHIVCFKYFYTVVSLWCCILCPSRFYQNCVVSLGDHNTKPIY